MARKYTPSADEVAMLTLHLIQKRDAARHQRTTRARISAKTLREISLRARLETAFLNEWLDHLSYLGWSGFQIGDNFGLIRSDVLEGWPRIGAMWIRNEITKLQRGDQSLIDELSEEFSPVLEVEDVEDND